MALAMNLRSLFLWRFVQAFGGSGSVSIGAAVIGDIYRREERGTGMGTFFGVSRRQFVTFRIVLTPS